MFTMVCPCPPICKNGLPDHGPKAHCVDLKDFNCFADKPLRIKKILLDNIHGYITLNRVETRILETLYYQRLRWIRQLGFSFYIFPGATHTRHAHALGVSHVMDRILKRLGLAAPADRLFDPKARDERPPFHRMMRLAAMLHDIGTFPFSHSIEMAYINHWRNKSQMSKPKYVANHEVLGSHIILN